MLSDLGIFAAGFAAGIMVGGFLLAIVAAFAVRVADRELLADHAGGDSAAHPLSSPGMVLTDSPLPERNWNHG